MHSGLKCLDSATFYSQEMRVPHAVSDTKEIQRILPKATSLSCVLQTTMALSEIESQEFPAQALTLKEPNAFFLRSGLALLLSSGDGHEAWAKSREFPMQILIFGTLCILARSSLARLRSTGNGHLRVPHAISNNEGIRHILARNDLILLLSIGDYGFKRESRVPYVGSDIDATHFILVKSNLALLLSTSDCIEASILSREFPKRILIPKELDSFWPEMAWLSYFLRVIVM
ncbi:hypothetical protein Csa_016042 [Cucumis sativus]|uniref:Uncharacterized protein n=1 Tax=Cucumis sativus TaxID=3659 RepID=A0A0A0K7T2_CUCSA|nr:hypothetical protein Csa_016042 [Cucumis sativus]